MERPASGGVQPPEWEPHAAVWTAWPSHADYWDGHVEAARSDIAGFLAALALPQPKRPVPEAVHLWVDGEDQLAEVKRRLEQVPLTIHAEPFGDIWLRDTGPIFVREADGKPGCRVFRNNGWGGKYLMPGDETVGARIAALASCPAQYIPLVFEGGSLEVDGTGLGLTTRSCLLNPNRNPWLGEQAIAACICTALGLRELIWLDDGLANDHTDGHIDNIARFIGPRRVLCQHPAGADDPNAAVLRRIEATLRAWRDAEGGLEVFTIPSPGRVVDAAGAVLPASHLNFYIANHAVLVPVYGTASQEAAVDALRQLFPGRAVLGLPANGVLMGGGAFHCMTQQQPLL